MPREMLLGPYCEHAAWVPANKCWFERILSSASARVQDEHDKTVQGVVREPSGCVAPRGVTVANCGGARICDHHTKFANDCPVTAHNRCKTANVHGPPYGPRY
jgi:hypothetical protein